MSLLQVNYDELSQVSKLFRDDGDNLAQVYSTLRTELQALQHDWVGEAAEAFFAEMEEVLLPALKRTYEALHLSSDMTREIMKLIHDADQETGGYFKADFGADFGAGLFAQAGTGLGTGSPGGDDFGASGFEEALPGQGADSGEGALKIPTAPEVSKKDMELDEPPASEKQTAAAASGGGGGSSSGAQGDLKGLGSALGAQPAQASAVGGVEPEIPDHIFDSGTAAPAGGPGSAPGGAGSAPAGSEEPGSGAAAGVAGAAGAAAIGAAAKALKDKSEQSG
jgi:WXG100 family type VII secretion target